MNNNQLPEDSYLKNFGMMIPSGAYELMIEIEDPNGVPIYAKCPANGGACACTGACRQIIDYDTDPENILAYRAKIQRHNDLLKDRINSFPKPDISNEQTGIRIWTWGKGDDNPTKQLNQ